MEDTSSPSAEPCPQSAAAKWYCLRTHLKHEHIAAAHLSQLDGVAVYHPRLRILRSTRRGRRWFWESLFPNYLFVRFVLNSQLERITHTTAVKGVLRFGDHVPEIADATIRELESGMDELEESVLTDSPVAGDEVEIAGGAFAGMSARVVQVLPGKERARVLLNLMGQPVPADLSLELLVVNRRPVVSFALEPSHQIPDARSTAG
jgi:transcriptional antiterminator RfaH